ncbi:transcriptional regulator [Erythrobacter sp. SG61-1L]|uniref:MarR family winged helix-turn-helix transcriptional regulator n=1 Tax=Erythrobacter sp. SG61-1L TaxID=1603897 RepID=UPI0006C91A91|nr:MarR family winged helix-turn-helix transcriptional regulator [Erythrobacter sp. SG61-1L]KPL67843.1 transcriptional regulator [Erythrobacter sp. SG61-1L]
MTHIGFLLADNSRLARWSFDQQVRAAGVTGPQARMLLMLERKPGENQGFYAEQLEVEPITLCRMVDRLEEAGLVERRRDPADRRAWQLHLTDKSRQMVGQIRHEADLLVDMMLEGVSEEDRAEFHRLLKIVGTNLAARRESTRTIARASNG